MELLWELSDTWPREPVPALPAEVGASLFLAGAVVAGRALLQIGRPDLSGASPVYKGMQMRRVLVLSLLVANAARCMSLLAQLAFEEDAPLPPLSRLSPDQLGWLSDLVAILPGMIFLSAFSVVVLFWAQLHYTTTIVPLPLLDCLFVCANAACYLLVAAVAACTFALRAYSRFRKYANCIVAFLNATVAIAFIYYGYMVVSELSDTARKKLPGQRLTPRVVSLTVVVPLALLARSACFFAWGFSLGRPTWALDFALDLSAEWLPSVLALAILSPSQRYSMRSPGGPLDDDSDSEAPLLQDDVTTPQRALAGGAPGLTWKQLYPQPDQTGSRTASPPPEPVGIGGI